MRRLVRKPDGPDPRDHRYVSTRAGAMLSAPPPAVDLRYALPPAFDQGDEGSCGPHAASALMCYLKRVRDPFSRQQIYYSVRKMENSVKTDDGVETRDLFKALNLIGAAPESLWPYTPRNLFQAPPPSVLIAARANVIGNYMRLVGEDDMISCLSEGFPFVVGFWCYSSFEEDVLARTGVMAAPNIKKEHRVGGHDALAVGYDLRFRSNPAFKKSGVDQALVGDHALLVRNSWGTDWGIQGHFWMPMSYAVNPSTGGDAWTGRL